MKRLYLYILAGLVFLFCVQSSALAKLYINEFSSYTTGDDWVELYNSDESEISVVNYCIGDDLSIFKYLKDFSDNLSAKSFSIFELGNRLNRSNDSIKLYSNCDSDNPKIVDSVTYGESENDIFELNDGQTAGILTDGGEEWGIFAQATKGEANSASPIPTSTPVPTETPVPTNTPTPSKTSTPTKIPTPTKTPTPMKAPTSTKTPTPMKAAILSNTSNNSTSKTSSKSLKTNIEPSSRKAQIVLSDDILGISTKSAVSSKSAKKVINKPQIIIAGSSSGNLSYLFVPAVISVLFIASAILVFFRIKKSKKIADDG